MIDESKPEDKGVAAALIERFEKWILPHALEIKAKVAQGEKLDDFDIDFLENELKDAEAIKPYVDRAPEYQTLYTRAISLYGEVHKKHWRMSRLGQSPAPAAKFACMKGQLTLEKHTLSLVLGSGGARGYAHIGVISWLNDHGFDIRSIAGSSMGALIGGIYATGKLDAYTEWVLALNRSDVLQLLDLSFGRSGLFKGERVMRALRDLIGEYDIENLPVSFTAVATDLDTGKEVWLSKGPLFDALRASIAIPTLFTPFQYKGRRLVDGELVNPLIAPTLRDMTDLTIAVNLSGREEPNLVRPTAHDIRVGEPRYKRMISEFIEELVGKRPSQKEMEELGMFDVISQAVDTMQNTISRLKLATYSPDILIDIPKNACYFYEFDRADEMIELGRHRAEEALAKRKL